jgi:hypothetical protein
MKTKYLPFNKHPLLVETHALFWCGIHQLSSQKRPVPVQKTGLRAAAHHGSAPRGHGLKKPEKG